MDAVYRRAKAAVVPFFRSLSMSCIQTTATHSTTFLLSTNHESVVRLPTTRASYARRNAVYARDPQFSRAIPAQHGGAFPVHFASALLITASASIVRLQISISSVHRKQLKMGAAKIPICRTPLRSGLFYVALSCIKMIVVRLHFLSRGFCSVASRCIAESVDLDADGKRIAQTRCHSTPKFGCIRDCNSL